jgi:hypothetical protein
MNIVEREFTNNPEMAKAIQNNPTFKSILLDVINRREMQRMRYAYVYHATGEVAGQATLPFTIQVEQGTDFDAMYMLGSAYSYDTTYSTDYPIPNSAGITAWAGRGLSVQITDSSTGNQLTSGFVPFECLFTPGYGQNFQHPLPFRYFALRNTKIRFDVRNRESNTSRTHEFEIVMMGFKVATPDRQ